MKIRIYLLLVLLIIISLISSINSTNSLEPQIDDISIKKLDNAEQYKLDESIDSLKIIRFIGPVEEGWKKALEDNGAILMDYIPENAYIAKITTENIDHLLELNFIDSIYDYKLEYKVDNEIFSEDSKDNMIKSKKNEVIEVNIIIDDKNKSIDILDKLDDDIFITGISNDTISALVDKSQIKGIAELEEVNFIEKSLDYKISNDIASTIIEANNSWILHGLSGRGQIIGISDSGLDNGADNHSITGDIHLDIDNRATLYNWYGSSPDDDHGHGTHVTGSVAGNGTRSNGNIRGMAYNANIIFQGLGDDQGSNSVYPPSDLYTLFQQAYNDGARIHTNSWGANSNSYNSDAKEVDEFMWNNTDMLILFAAGNNGAAGTNTVGIPASNKNGLAIGSSENYRPDKGSTADDINTIASSSSQGPAHDSRIKPDLSAPGTYILSMLSNKTSNPCGRGDNGTYYTFCSGTSMATPIAAGAAALVRQYLNNNLSLNASAAMVKAVLIHGAQDIGYGRISNKTGFGRINLTSSLFPDFPISIIHIDNKTGLNTNDISLFTYNLNNESVQFKVTLAWTDYPSTTIASKNLVNDLDLTVTSPNGSIYLGNDIYEPYNNQYDDTNNVEVIWIDNGPTGPYKINVSARNVPNGPQPYALVISGALDMTIPSITFNNNTPNNNSITSNTTILINISSNKTLANAILEWNGTNITMNGSGTIFFLNKTLSGNGTISFKVFGNDTGHNIGVSETRYILFQNSAPIIGSFYPEASQISIAEPNNQIFNITSSDINNDNLTVVWQQNGTNVSYTNSFTFIGNYSSSGAYNITAKVADAWNQDTMEWLLIVNDTNTPPQIIQVTVNSSDEGNRTNGTLSGYFSYNDDENNTIDRNETFWFKNGLINQNLTNLTIITANYTTKYETWIFSIRIFDGSNWSSWMNSSPLYITNSKPILSQIANISINETKSINITVTVTDNDLDDIIYSINNSLFSKVANNFNYTSNINDSSIISVTINVSDGNLTANSTFTITIIDQPDLDTDGIIDAEDFDDDNDQINDSLDKIYGNISFLNTTNDLNIYVNHSNNLSINLNGTFIVNITDTNNITILEFNWNFTNRSLFLNWTIHYVPQNGTLVIKGLDLMNFNFNKTIYINQTNSANNHVCILDDEVPTIESLSENCNAQNETRLECPGTNKGYTCNDLGNYFKVSGLNHSAVKPISVAVVSLSSGSSSGGGGGGSGSGGSGGGSGAAVENPTTVSKYFAILTPNFFPNIVINEKIIPISLITFKSNDIYKDVRINISLDDNPPAGLIYKKYSSIFVTSDSLSNDDISDVKITLRINSTWLDENDLTTDDITIFYYVEGWKTIKPTFVKIEEESSLFTFEAPLFSHFIISSEKLKLELHTKPLEKIIESTLDISDIREINNDNLPKSTTQQLFSPQIDKAEYKVHKIALIIILTWILLFFIYYIYHKKHIYHEQLSK